MDKLLVFDCCFVPSNAPFFTFFNEKTVQQLVILLLLSTHLKR